MSLRCWIKQSIEDDDLFLEHYEKLLQEGRMNNKKIILFGMQFINLIHFPQDKLIYRNKQMKALASKYDYPFIDIFRLQKELISKVQREYTCKYRFIIRVIDAIIMTLCPSSKDWFAKIRGLTSTVDGAHFNSVSAKILAHEIEKILTEQ